MDDEGYMAHSESHGHHRQSCSPFSARTTDRRVYFVQVLEPCISPTLFNKLAILNAHSFFLRSILGVAPRTARFNTALRPAIPETDMTAEQMEIKKISEKWAEVRLLTREEAESTLDAEWLEAYNRFFQKFDDDMTRMQDIAQQVIKSIEPPKVQKKSLGQKKRDKWAKVQAREAARAKNK
jgi:hypothetical protein